MAKKSLMGFARWSSDPKLHELVSRLHSLISDRADSSVQGRWNQFRLNGGIEGFMLRLLTTTLGWSYERSQVHLARMRTELRDYRTHAYLPGTVVYARKPGPGISSPPR
jgi:hypothetical protein